MEKELKNNMININELRLGNWVYTDEHNMRPMQIESIARDYVYLNFKGNKGGLIKSDYNKISPIPITGKMLEKIGFIKNNLYGYDRHFIYSSGGLCKYNMELTALYDCDFSICICGRCMGIESIHKLQNIMLDFFKKELFIKKEWLYEKNLHQK